MQLYGIPDCYFASFLCSYWLFGMILACPTDVVKNSTLSDAYLTITFWIQKISCKMPKHMNVVLQGYWLSNSSLSFFFYSRWSSRKILDYLLVIIHYSYNWDTDVYPAILQQYLTVNLQYSCISCIYLAELLHMTDICKNSSRNRGHTRDSWIYAVYLVRFRNREYATVIFWKSGTSDWYFASVFNMHCLSCKILAYPTYVLHNSHSSDASLPRSLNIQSYLAILRNL